MENPETPIPKEEDLEADLVKAVAPEVKPDDPANQPEGTTGESTQAATVAKPAAESTDQEPKSEPTPIAGSGDGDAKPSAGDDVQPPAARANAGAARPVVTESQKRLAEVESLILADEYDPYSKEGRQLQLEHNRLSAKVEAEPLHAAERDRTAYAAYTEQYPDIPEKDMRSEFKDQLKVYAAKGLTGRDLEIAATTAFEFKLEQKANGHKGQQAAQEAKDPKPTAKTPITAKGGRVVPPSGNAVPAQPSKAKSDEEELVDTVTKLEPRGIKALMS